MQKSRRSVVAAVVIGCLGLVFGAGTASAAPALSTAPVLSSTGFAGWLFGTTGTVTTTVTYKEPAITCGTANQGVSPQSIIINGTSTAPQEQSAGTLVICNGGAAHYVPFLVINGTETNLTNAVNAGDNIKLVVTASKTKVSATFSDLTAPRTFSKTLSGTSTTGALQEQMGDGKVLISGATVPVVKFGTISFAGGKVNTKLLGAVTPRQGPYNMVSSTNVTQIATSALLGTPTPSGFRTTWKHS